MAAKSVVENESSFGSYARLFGKLLLGLVGAGVVLCGWLAAWGLQVAGVEVLARALGASPIDAWAWSHLAGIPAAIELVALIFLACFLQERQRE